MTAEQQLAERNKYDAMLKEKLQAGLDQRSAEICTRQQIEHDKRLAEAAKETSVKTK